MIKQIMRWSLFFAMSFSFQLNAELKKNFTILSSEIAEEANDDLHHKT